VAAPKHRDLLSSGAGLASAIAVEVHGELGEDLEPVKARGYWEQVWLRLKRDRVAIAGGIFIVALLLIAFVGAPLAERQLGHGPNDSQLGRDMFLRLLYGAQTSLEVAVLATLLSVSIGLLMGLIAGYYRGWVDTIVSRLTEIVMAFPFLLFVIAVAATVGERLNSITFGGLLHPGVFTLVVIFGIFGWFYPARIIRSQILSLREKEFVEAARMTGASDLRIMKSHLLPHLVAPLIVYSTLIVANNVIAEAGLSFLGLGIPAPTASWGNLLAEGPNYYLTQPWLMVWPGMAILLTTLAFNLLGDGLRDAFDPRHAR
jgi:ABC-type dipeptide/oligopeptide/nickel transport system permease subunit